VVNKYNRKRRRKMLLYHDSSQIVERPKIINSIINEHKHTMSNTIVIQDIDNILRGTIGVRYTYDIPALLCNLVRPVKFVKLNRS
jgi:hypothetical protein